MKKDEIQDELKNLGEEPSTQPDTNENEKMLVDKKDWENVMERLAKVESGVTSTVKEEVPLEKKKSTVKVRFLDDKIVIGYGSTFEKKDIDGRRYLILQVITEDNETHEVEYLPFMNQGKFELAEVLEIKKDYLEQVDGKIYQTEYDYKNYRSIVTDKLVEMKVTIPDFKYVVKLSDGREITLPNRALN